MGRFLLWTGGIRRFTVWAMKRIILIGMSAACGLALSAISALGQGVPDHTLSDFKLGELISGDEVDLSSLEGKVVVFEYWGTQ